MSEFYFKTLNFNVLLIKIYKNYYKHNFLDLMNLILLKNKFCSFTKTDDEISLIVDEKSFLNIDLHKGINKLCTKYKIIQFYEEGSGIQHIGIVKKISSLFSKSNIPILYVNSYNNNYVLIELKDFDKSLILLKINKFILCD